MRRVLVFGAGRSGKAAEVLLRSHGFGVSVLDGDASFPAATGMSPPRAGMALGSGDRNVAAPSWDGVGRCGDRNVAAPAEVAAEVGEATFLSPPEGGVDFAVVSPGIALTHPWVVEAKRRGIPLKSELQLGCEELKRQGWELLAVTGSKGKSSVVKVVTEAINLAGGHAAACGNYGLPVCEVARGSGDRNVAASTESAVAVGEATFLSPRERWAVVEISSFMMETTDLPPDTFEAAAILNLQEDHLDRHGSVGVYHGLKRKLLTFAKKGFCPAATGMSPPRLGEGVAAATGMSPPRLGEGVAAATGMSPPRAGGATEVGVATFLSPQLWTGSYFDNEILAGNAAIAAELMRVAGLDDAKIAAAFRAFVPLPHRMNPIAEIGGVRYIDDSKATSIAALIAGVKMASSGNRTIEQSNNRTILLIAGGLPKGDAPETALSTLTERVKKVYLMGQSADAFFAAWKGAVDCEICGTMDKAVEKAMREAEKGETVLLSPGTASFDQFQSYGERGDVFARLVKKEGQAK